ncbi:hypothetical protein CYPRO_2321 [Cyclonatronum proteinivorum]|uniref:Uncharacterized protein n=2 Tax=Cyclonatronum proteinivorum TaxID=1457365 RepID=A0A345UM65_9BACT|nr:hypothetical protein CYPRO_2321 [Cyclonatronum proteinivorum]
MSEIKTLTKKKSAMNELIKRLSSAPLPKLNPDEQRKPVFWLHYEAVKGRYPLDDETAVYFVNGSGFVLDRVCRTPIPKFSSLTEFEPQAPHPNFDHTEVRPGEAVVIDAHDYFYDKDAYLCADVTLRHEKIGTLRIIGETRKGTISEGVLLWDTGEPGTPKIKVLHLDPNDDDTKKEQAWADHLRYNPFLGREEDE